MISSNLNIMMLSDKKLKYIYNEKILIEYELHKYNHE